LPVSLVAKWLKVGIIEDGRVTRSHGARQGAVISPILANVYLHYAYDLWVQRWRRTKASGEVIVVRFADVVGFEHEHEAKIFLHDLHERLREFELDGRQQLAKRAAWLLTLHWTIPLLDCGMERRHA
jgi:RNA-directed DNA polymerase